MCFISYDGVSWSPTKADNKSPLLKHSNNWSRSSWNISQMLRNEPLIIRVIKCCEDGCHRLHTSHPHCEWLETVRYRPWHPQRQTAPKISKCRLCELTLAQRGEILVDTDLELCSLIVDVCCRYEGNYCAILSAQIV